jgi:hypothetical protein
MQGVLSAGLSDVACCMTPLVGKLCRKYGRCSYPCDDGARPKRRSLLFLISHLMDALMLGRVERVTAGKPRHSSLLGLF